MISKALFNYLTNTVTVINIASKTFTDSNPRPVVHCLMGGGYIGPDIPISQKIVDIYRQDDRDMTNDKMTMYIFVNILQY